MRRLNRYFNEVVVNNNKNENLSSSDSQLSSISSAENTRANRIVINGKVWLFWKC